MDGLVDIEHIAKDKIGIALTLKPEKKTCKRAT